MPDYSPSLNGSVPSADSADNDTPADVVGSKTDTIAGDSLVAFAKKAVEGPGAIVTLPAAAAGVTVTAGAAGVAGSYAELDDGATLAPAVPFRVVGISFDTPSAGMIGTVEVASGAGGAEAVVASSHFEIATDAGFIPPIWFPPNAEIAASTRLAVRLTTVGGAETIKASLMVQPV